MMRQDDDRIKKIYISYTYFGAVVPCAMLIIKGNQSDIRKSHTTLVIQILYVLSLFGNTGKRTLNDYRNCLIHLNLLFVDTFQCLSALLFFMKLNNNVFFNESSQVLSWFIILKGREIIRVSEKFMGAAIAWDIL